MNPTLEQQLLARIEALEAKVAELLALRPLEAFQTDDAGQICLAIVSQRARIPLGLLTGSNRTERVSEARWIGMHLQRSRFGCRDDRIGDACGGRDHGTVMHGIATLRDRRTESRVLQLIAAACERDLDQHLAPQLVAA